MKTVGMLFFLLTLAAYPLFGQPKDFRPDFERLSKALLEASLSAESGEAPSFAGCDERVGDLAIMLRLLAFHGHTHLTGDYRALLRPHISAMRRALESTNFESASPCVISNAAAVLTACLQISARSGDEGLGRLGANSLMKLMARVPDDGLWPGTTRRESLSINCRICEALLWESTTRASENRRALLRRAQRIKALIADYRAKTKDEQIAIGFCQLLFGLDPDANFFDIATSTEVEELRGLSCYLLTLSLLREGEVPPSFSAALMSVATEHERSKTTDDALSSKALYCALALQAIQGDDSVNRVSENAAFELE
jgi:hypothetical protein